MHSDSRTAVQTGARDRWNVVDRKILLVDMDGVLGDFDLHFCEIWKEKYPDRRQIDRSNRTSHLVAGEFPEAMQSDVREIVRMPGFYLDIPVVQGAVEALRELSESDIEVWICTCPSKEYQNCVPEKYQWVERHLGMEWTRRIIMIRDKSLVQGTFLIDDNPQLPNRHLAAWRQILFDTPYNRMDTSLPRITWANWREVLERLGLRLH